MEDRYYLMELEKLDTASISDVLDGLGISGGLLGIVPQVPNANLFGRAYTVSYREVTGTDREAKVPANFIDDVPNNFIPVLANKGNMACTVWGDILTRCAQKKNVKGTIIDGCCRDIKYIRANHYNMFSKGVFMQTGKGRTVMSDINIPVYIGDVKVYPGDYVKGDDNGVVVIPEKYIDKVIELSKNVKNKEQMIKNMIDKGERLDIARKKVNYNHVWEKL